MINEEIANKVVSIEINVLKATYQEILNNINKLHHRSKQHGSLGKLVKAEGNEVKESTPLYRYRSTGPRRQLRS